MKRLLYVLFALFLVPRTYAVTPAIPDYTNVRFTQAQINEMTADADHPRILRTLIKCESENTDVARPDSNGLISYGILQFNGTSTWDQFSPLANVSGTPMNPYDAIKVADYMIDHGYLYKWTCAKLTGLLP